MRRQLHACSYVVHPTRSDSSPVRLPGSTIVRILLHSRGKRKKHKEAGRGPAVHAGLTSGSGTESQAVYACEKTTIHVAWSRSLQRETTAEQPSPDPRPPALRLQSCTRTRGRNSEWSVPCSSSSCRTGFGYITSRSQ